MKAQHHLTTFLTKMAEHHVTLAKAHADMAEDCEPDSPQHEFHKNSSNAHAGMGETAVEACKMLMESQKAMGVDLDALVPTNVSAVTPNHPGVRAVPRVGMRPIPVPDVDVEFSKIFGTDEE